MAQVQVRCETCRYWSELIAFARGGDIQAVCLSADSGKYGAYTSATHSCRAWTFGRPVDDPRGPEEVRC